MNRCDWIIGIYNSEASGVGLFKFVGTEEEVHAKLIELVNEDRMNDEENWDSGCETVDDICANSNGLGTEFYAYGCYSNYHIDYSAKEFTNLFTI